MLSLGDSRLFLVPEDRYSHCVFCGRDLVVLPNDRRRGACFDCYSPLGPESVDCPGCGFEIPGEERTAGCPRCGLCPRPLGGSRPVGR